jgi:hypothetical protein
MTEEPLRELGQLVLQRLLRARRDNPQWRPRLCGEAVLRGCPHDRGRCRNELDYITGRAIRDVPEELCAASYDAESGALDCFDGQALAEAFNGSPQGPTHPGAAAVWRNTPGCAGFLGALPSEAGADDEPLLDVQARLSERLAQHPGLQGADAPRSCGPPGAARRGVCDNADGVDFLDQERRVLELPEADCVALAPTNGATRRRHCASAASLRAFWERLEFRPGTGLPPWRYRLLPRNPFFVADGPQDKRSWAAPPQELAPAHHLWARGHGELRAMAGEREAPASLFASFLARRCGNLDAHCVARVERAARNYWPEVGSQVRRRFWQQWALMERLATRARRAELLGFGDEVWASLPDLVLHETPNGTSGTARRALKSFADAALGLGMVPQAADFASAVVAALPGTS